MSLVKNILKALDETRIKYFSTKATKKNLGDEFKGHGTL